MLDMGFLCPTCAGLWRKSQQSDKLCSFSATLPPEIERLAAWVLRDPELVEIGAAVRLRKQSPTRFIQLPLNKNSIC